MIRSSLAHLPVTALSHSGMVGKNNEDRYAVSSFQLSAEDPRPVVFAVVADGIGGHRAGEVAAELAVNYISQGVAESNGIDPVQILGDAIRDASQAVAAHSASRREQAGMGATCACVWVVERSLYVAHVGDSRVYLLRGDAIRQLTLDHTWVQEAIERGILAPEEARDHPNVHVIRRYLGSAQPPEVDFRLYLGE
ncbi:MAG: protein phosphatase 2C domain-containing protein, partial [Bacteroidota bacterium]